MPITTKAGTMRKKAAIPTPPERSVDGVDLVSDPVGWVLVLVGLVRHRANLPVCHDGSVD